MDTILQLRESLINSLFGYLGFIKILSALVSGALLAGIIYILVKTNYFASKVEGYVETFGAANLFKHRTVRAWRQIVEKMKLGDEANLKLAIIEADKILDETLKASGYKGETTADRLKQVDRSKISNIEQLWQTHKIRNKIVKDSDFHVNYMEAKLALEIYYQSRGQFYSVF